MENYIKVKKRDIFKLGIADEQGNPKLDDNGNEVYLEFDLADVNLPLRLNKCDHLIKKAQSVLKMKIVAIDKKEDKRGKMLLSKNEEEKALALKEYYDEMEKAMDLFIGEGGTKKVFGNRRYWEMYEDLSEMLAPFLPQMKLTVNDMTNRIKEKYKIKEENVLKND